MNNNVIHLRSFRQRKRRQWHSRHNGKLSVFVESFIQSMRPEIRSISERSYEWQYESSPSWDYQDFRDLLHSALEEICRMELYHELKKQWWFDASIISSEEVTEFCLATLLEPTAHANTREFL